MTTKFEIVTHEVCRIVMDNSVNYPDTSAMSFLADLTFDTTSGRHEIEAFFGIDFEQEQVDAWETVQNIIDDVMNLWVAPITDPVVKGANLETVQRLQRQLGESEKAFNERVLSAVKRGDYVAISTGTDENGKAVVAAVEINPSKSGVVGHVGEEAVTPKPSEVINRIERSFVNEFASVLKDGDVMQQCVAKNAIDMYQEIATKSAIYPGKGTPFGLMYAALGLAEAGEVQNKVKKAFRDDGVISFHGKEEAHTQDGPWKTGRQVVSFDSITPERRAQIIKELGGALWYIAAVCDEIGATMSEVALQNLDELCGRGERNTLRGDGDNR